MAEDRRDHTNVARLKEAHQNFNNRNFDALKELVADNITYQDHPTGRTFNGREEFIMDWLQGWTEGFSDGRLEDITYIDGGDRVVALTTGRGTNDGSFGPFPSTGRQAEFRACEIVRFNDSGQMISGEVFYDQMTILAQLGHIEEPAVT